MSPIGVIRWGSFVLGRFSLTLGLDNARITMESKSAPGDVNGDGVVDVLDLIEVINQWGSCDRPPATGDADLNGDGEVNVTDLVLVITNWSV